MIQIGSASKVITPPVGSWVQGATVTRRATAVRDELEANALYLADEAAALLLVSCDVAALESPVIARAREAMAAAAGLPPRDIIIACTHTHGGPSLLATNYRVPVDAAYIDSLQGWLVALAQEAVESARPGRLGWAQGEVQVGYNRRCCWADGTHTMHGDTTRKDFAGLEGPDDPQHLALLAVDAEGRPIAILHHNTSHPTIFYGAGVFSADFPGAARAFLRQALGPLPVLFLNGAFGDISLEDMRNVHRGRETREQKLARAAHAIAGETLRLIGGAALHEAPVLRHAHEDLQIEVRLPEPETLAGARELLARVDAGEEVPAFDLVYAYGAILLQERFAGQPFDTVPVHAVRVGKVALVTQPCELYCQFGLDIKRRSPTPLTAVASVADGYGGYCPTIAGVLGGGYSGRPIHWCRLAPDAGYRIVESAARLLNALWRS